MSWDAHHIDLIDRVGSCGVPEDGVDWSLEEPEFVIGPFNALCVLCFSTSSARRRKARHWTMGNSEAVMAESVPELAEESGVTTRVRLTRVLVSSALIQPWRLSMNLTLAWGCPLLVSRPQMGALVVMRCTSRVDIAGLEQPAVQQLLSLSRLPQSNYKKNALLLHPCFNYKWLISDFYHTPMDSVISLQFPALETTTKEAPPPGSLFAIFHSLTHSLTHSLHFNPSCLIKRDSIKFHAQALCNGHKLSSALSISNYSFWTRIPNVLHSCCSHFLKNPTSYDAPFHYKNVDKISLLFFSQRKHWHNIQEKIHIMNWDRVSFHKMNYSYMLAGSSTCQFIHSWLASLAPTFDSWLAVTSSSLDVTRKLIRMQVCSSTFSFVHHQHSCYYCRRPCPLRNS